MQKKGVCVLAVLLVFLYHTADRLAAEAELKPHNVIVRSSFKEDVMVPVITQHQYDLFEPREIEEPYLPHFVFDVTLLPDDFPQNAEISWLTGLSPSLARFFRGNAGRLENGILYYQQNRLSKAESELLPLLNQSSEFRENALLYLAWIKYKEQLWVETITLASHLLQSRRLDLAKEAYYLTALVYLKQKQFKKVLALNEQLRSRISLDQFDIKQIYLHLSCLVQLGYWNDAGIVSDQIQKLPIIHTKVYYKLIELAGLIDFKKRNYDASLKRYHRAGSYNTHPAYQYIVLRHIAWLNYLSGNYESALTLLERPNSRYFPDNAEELAYLKLACLTQLKKWSGVKKILSQFQDKSIFHTYSSFLIRNHLKDPQEYPDLFDQVSKQRFKFPEMKFHVAILNGNMFFRQNQFRKAKEFYLRAMSADGNNQDFWIAEYNLGLTHLKLNQYRLAEVNFLNLMKSAHGALPDQLKYHLIYAQYQQSKSDPSWVSLKLIDFPSLKKSQHIELLLIKTGALLRMNKTETARNVLVKIWRLTKRQDALEFIVKIHYDRQQFDTVINLIQDHPKHRSDTLILYEIKSLLGKRNFKEAKRSINQIPEDRSSFLKLRLEVWAANREYEKIVKFVSNQLRKSLDNQQRRFYYLKLGDAYFNLQQYQKSKSQFYRALGLTKEPTLKSLILYNIALSSYYYGDFPSFLKEVKQVLKRKDITPEVRYNLTTLLAEYYQKNDNFAQADKSLENYTRSYSHNLASIHIKRIRLLLQSNRPKRCVKLGKTGVKGENDYQRRDRIIMFGYCANAIQQPSETIKLVQPEIRQANRTYRINELNFILAQAYSQVKDFKRSLVLAKALLTKQLTIKVRQDTQLLATQNLLQLKQTKQALAELGDANQYRITGQYIPSLQLRSEIELGLKQYHRAYRTLLRIYYLPTSSELVRQVAQLRITESYLNEKNLAAAKKHFKKIDPKIIPKGSSSRKRYQAVKAAIISRQSVSHLYQISTDTPELFHVKQFRSVRSFHFQADISSLLKNVPPVNIPFVVDGA